jgi:RNA polymerase sigma-70 factor (ECF subfamily)
LAGFEGRSRFSTWLYKIAYNTALNEVNRRKEYYSLAEEAVNDSSGYLVNNIETPEKIALRNAASKAIREAVQELPERFRICVDLFYFYDCSYQEIEVITGIPVNTIKSHVFRSKVILKEKLEYLIKN